MNIGSDCNWAVSMVSLDKRAGYNFSNLKIQNNGSGAVRDVAHFWFNTWPDHGVYVATFSHELLSPLRTTHKHTTPLHASPRETMGCMHASLRILEHS